jgi:lipoprotein NlpI
MCGEFKQSLADFDEQIRLAPDSAPGHWQRGISCYYAGEYAAGAKQFAAYHSKVDDNDVENSIWRSMCMTRASSLEKARADMLVVKHDRRVPMMEAYQMFAGKIATSLRRLGRGRPRVSRAGDPSCADPSRRGSAEEL